MTELSYTNWYAMSDKALLRLIGSYVKQSRLEQNKTQDVLAHEAGISRSTLSLLERGETVTLLTLLQVLRMLGKLELLEAFVVTPQISPIAMAKAEKYQRKRARGKGSKEEQGSEW